MMNPIALQMLAEAKVADQQRALARRRLLGSHARFVFQRPRFRRSGRR